MASTNKTVNYEFGQFLGTDKPSWLTDYNGDMIKIDLAIKTIEDLITDANSQINYITETVLLTKANKENPIITGVMDLQGGRIKFPVSNIASEDPNTLDDYEEGTFTPELIGSIANPTIEYTNQHGNYVKIGKLVTLIVSISGTITDQNGGTGSLKVLLPYVPASIGFQSVSVGLWSLATERPVNAYVDQQGYANFQGTEGKLTNGHLAFTVSYIV